MFLGKKLTEDGLNSLIAHAHRRIEQLQKQLAEQIALEQIRIQQSMEQQRKEDEKLTEQRVSDEQEKLRNSFLLQKERAVIINDVSNRIRILELWCLNATFNKVQLYHGDRFLFGGGNRSTRRKPQTCHKSLTNFII